MLLACQGRVLRADKARGLLRMAGHEVGFVEALAVAVAKVLSRYVCCACTQADEFFSGCCGGRCLLRRGGCTGESQAKQCNVFVHHDFRGASPFWPKG